MDLLTIWYRYINRFITSTEALDILKSLDLDIYSEEEQTEISKLISDLEHIIATIPNEVDDYVKKKKEIAKKYKEQIEQILAKTTDEEAKESFSKIKKNMENDLQKEIDGGKLFSTVSKLLSQNSLVNKYADNLDARGTLDFICKYFQVPFPLNISKDSYSELIDIGISDDAREKLFRLAFNYEGHGFDNSKIIDYYIEKRDAWFLTELVSAIKNDLDMDDILKKVIMTKDRAFMDEVKKQSIDSHLFDNKEWEHLLKLANELYATIV